MAGYVRQRNSEIANGNLANASHVADEFNQLQTSFNTSTGHSHGGATGEGAPITVMGPAQDLVVGSTTVTPKTTNTLSLGTGSLRFSNVHTNGITLGGTAVTSTAAELNILDGVTSTAAELNILDGVTSTTAELNILDGVTATAVEINVLDGITSSTAELNILDGVIATAAEINFIDGVTSNVQTQLNTKAPIAGPTFTGTATFPTVDINGGNIDGTVIGATSAAAGSFTSITLDGIAVTSTAAELNALDGITATVTELNFTDGVTSNIQTQLDGKQPIDADLTAIAAISSNGFIARTGSGTFATREFIGTENQVNIDNHTGVGGNPTIWLSNPSQAEAEAGLDDRKSMTALRVAQAIAANKPSVAGTTKTDTFSTTSTSWTAITGLTAAITPKTTASRVKVTVTLNVGSSETQPWMFQLTRNGSEIQIGDTAGSRTRVTAEIRLDESQTHASNKMETVSFTFLDSPASASLQTYGVNVAGVNRSGGIGTFYLNRSHTDTNASNYSRAASSIIVEEIL